MNFNLDFDKNPFIIFWEVTQACDLACRHCRAVAMKNRNPHELSTEEGKKLLDKIGEFDSPPIVIFTGGDILKREDIFELVEYALKLNLRVAVSPSGTPLLTKDKIRRFKDIGVERISFSLDGSNRYIHDSFRGVKGSFDATMRGLEYADEIGLSSQVNTTLTKWNYGDLETMSEFLKSLKIAMWDIFFLVPTGRATISDIISPYQFEEAFERIYAISKTVPYIIKSTAATHYRRFQIQEMEKNGEEQEVKGAFKGKIGRGHPKAGFTKGVTDGRGIMFISKTGDIFPSGFLPIKTGNVRRDDLIDVYRNNHIFKELRDPLKLKGKCGKCKYNEICGGSRARAYAVTGDYLEEEPFCVHLPQDVKIEDTLFYKIEHFGIEKLKKLK